MKPDRVLDLANAPGSAVRHAASPDLPGQIETALIIDDALRVVAAGPLQRRSYAGLQIVTGRLTTGDSYRDARLRQLVAAGLPASIDPCANDESRPASAIVPITSVEGADSQRMAIVIIRACKASEDNIAAVTEACELTAAEMDVLRHIYKGLSTVEAARALGIAKSTTRTHLRHIFDKTSTSRQSELVYFVANYPKGMSGDGGRIVGGGVAG